MTQALPSAGATREIPAAFTSFAGYQVATVKDRPQYVKAMIYGKPGAGKTYLASQASKLPQMTPVLYMVPDAAELDTLRKAAPDANTMLVTKWETFEKVAEEAARLVYDKRTALPFRTIIVDTGTEAQKLSMRDIMADLVKNGRPGGGAVDPDVPAQREWGMSISQMRRMIRSFRDLPINFILICHEQESRDNRGITWTTPDLPGKLRNQTAGMFSNVFYLYTKQDTETEGRKKVVTAERRLILTGLTEGYMAKSRTGAFPRVVEQPTMEYLYDCITQKDAEDAEEVK